VTEVKSYRSSSSTRISHETTASSRLVIIRNSLLGLCWPLYEFLQGSCQHWMLTSTDPIYQTVSVYRSCVCATCKESQARWSRKSLKFKHKIFSQRAIFAGLAKHSSSGNFPHLGWVAHRPRSIKTHSRVQIHLQKTPFLLSRKFQWIQHLKMTYRTPLRLLFLPMALQRRPELGHGSAKSWKMLKGFGSVPVWEGFLRSWA